jgi:hypothetical protein
MTIVDNNTGPNITTTTKSISLPSSEDPASTGEAYLPSMLPNEAIAWSRNQTKGIFHKHTITREWLHADG